MTLTAPARLNRQHGFRNTTRLEQEGRTWWAVGDGDTLADLIAFAEDSCRTDTTWQPTRRWNDLYGD
jgi:hypothetical protein